MPTALVAHCCGRPSCSGRTWTIPVRPSAVVTRTVHVSVCSVPSSLTVSSAISASNVASGVQVVPPSLTGRCQPSEPPRTSYASAASLASQCTGPEVAGWSATAAATSSAALGGSGSARSATTRRALIAPERPQVGAPIAPVVRAEGELPAVAQQVRPACRLPGLVRLGGEPVQPVAPAQLGRRGLAVAAHQATSPLGWCALARKPDAMVREVSPGSSPMRSAAHVSRSAVRFSSSAPVATSCPSEKAARISVSFR